MRHILIAALLLGGCATDFGREGEPWTDMYNEPQDKAVPGDVRKFIVKAQGCGHFSGEGGDDNPPERAAFLKKQTDELCTGLSEERAKLLRKYPNDLAVAKIIQGAWDDYGFE